MLAFALRQALVPRQGVRCATCCARRAPRCGCRSCSGHASTEAGEAQWGWALGMLLIGFLLGGVCVFFVLRHVEFGVTRPTTAPVRVRVPARRRFRLWHHRGCHALFEVAREPVMATRSLDLPQVQVLVHFDQDNDGLEWHHRVLLHRIAETRWGTPAPDFELTVHDLAVVEHQVLDRTASLG